MSQILIESLLQLKKIKSQKIGLFATSRNENRTIVSFLKNKPRTMVEPLALVQNLYTLNQFGFQPFRSFECMSNFSEVLII